MLAVQHIDDVARSYEPVAASFSTELSSLRLGLHLTDILCNSLILRHIAPYLSVSSLLNLARTNHYVRDVILQTPGVFRHLDLSSVHSAQSGIDGGIDRGGEVWRNVQMDESLTEDDFYSGPLRNIFGILQRQCILANVHTLVLDGLSVTADLCHEIFTNKDFAVRVLSIREVKNLNHGKLRASLRYICRPTRPEGTPRLKALYVFGPRDGLSSRRIHGNEHAGSTVGSAWNQHSHKALSEAMAAESDAWWSRKGKIFHRNISEQWAHTLLACRGMVAFDAVLCQGPCHLNSPVAGRNTQPSENRPPQWAVATVALDGCMGCGSAPEGMSKWGKSLPIELPLLTPPPVLSSTVKAATQPHDREQAFVARCPDCIRRRHCASCDKWWCEDCYQLGGTNAKEHVVISCWECGNNCHECIERTQRTCRGCRGEFCITHNEGSTATMCDWCSAQGALGRL